MSDKYKPTEHEGLKEDGTPDKRVGTGEFAYGQVDPHEAGAKGGHATGSPDTDESYENEGGGGGSGGSSGGQFAHGKVDPHEAGKKGGRSSNSGSS